MGASGWSYFVPYQTDISNALRELREAVFERGEYFRRAPYWKNMPFADFLPPVPDLMEEEKADYLAEFQKLQNLPEPTSIETLLEWNGEDGTHSILDIDKIGSEAGFGVAAPLSKSELKNFFGTDKPTRKMVEGKERNLDTFLVEKIRRNRG